jgi:hypothetical protein
MPVAIHITGASGSGTSTLGRALVERLGAVHLDTDDFYWSPVGCPTRRSSKPARSAGSCRAVSAPGRRHWFPVSGWSSFLRLLPRSPSRGCGGVKPACQDEAATG